LTTDKISLRIDDRTAGAVAHYWQTRTAQRKEQEAGVKPIKVFVVPLLAALRWMDLSTYHRVD